MTPKRKRRREAQLVRMHFPVKRKWKPGENGSASRVGQLANWQAENR